MDAEQPVYARLSLGEWIKFVITLVVAIGTVYFSIDRRIESLEKSDRKQEMEIAELLKEQEFNVEQRRKLYEIIDARFQVLEQDIKTILSKVSK